MGDPRRDHRRPGRSPPSSSAGVEFPKSWSQNATNIVAQKYFRGQLGSPERETSVKQMVGRVAGRIADWGREGGYFASDEDADAFEAELTSILVNQKAAFNSPVWFNVGLEGARPSSARPASSSRVEDDMESILYWNTKEGMIFKGGSGSGINLSKIRGSMEPLSKGGIASRPGQLHARRRLLGGRDQVGRRHAARGQDGRARRRPPGHREVHLVQGRRGEEGAAPEAPPTSTCDSTATASPRSSSRTPTTRSASPTSSCRRSRTARTGTWSRRIDGEPIKTVTARELMDQIADAAWQCADPGIQYDTTINRWHT